MKSKPLFSWVLPAVDAREKVNLSVAIQEFYRKVESMNTNEVKHTLSDEIVAMKEAMSEKGVRIVEPKWFASLLN